MNKNNPLGDFTDEVGEQLEDLPQIAKKQIIGANQSKPVASKKVLSQLSRATAGLAQTRLKQVREELEKQRLKTGSSDQPAPVGPGVLGSSKEIPQQKKLVDDAVAQTLKSSKSTGEFGRQVGG